MLQNTVNHKVYIGQTRHQELSKRRSARPSLHKANAHLANAIRKYGPDGFSLNVLCHASCQQDLDLLEQFWIAAYKSTNPQFGYNQQSGGRKWQGQYTKELRQAISEGARKAWARKTPKERWEHAFGVKIRWLMRTERQRKRITSPMWHCPREYRPWNKGLKGWNAGQPSPRKGMKCGPQKNPCREPHTEEHKQKISQGLKQYFKRRRSEKA